MKSYQTNAKLHNHKDVQRVAEAQQYHAIDDDQTVGINGLLKRSPKYKSSFLTEMCWLIWRSSIDTFKNPPEFRIRFVLSIIIGVLFGLLFQRSEYNQQAFQNISAVIFMLIINCTFSNVQDNADVFFISTKTIPNWLIWIKYLLWLYYSNEMRLINPWEDVKSLDCNQVGNGTCYRNGTDVLDYCVFKKEHYNRNLGLLFALFIVFRLISFGILVLRAKFQRKVG
ncbi:unnamed protein product [Rotaria socialis]|uniref:ABC-2 type transporter transmembrane domain-containing protein n=1 Tax=Rotaria socialis TaxID=392032 RepID=A0A821C027_9BILA|nr:unnamed protein product [Rotaria socialis]